MNEKQIQDQIREYLTIKSWFVVRIHQTLGCHPGVPDLICYGPGGQRIDIEVKGPRGKQSEAQQRYQEEIKRRGHRYLLTRSVEDVMDL